MDENTFWLLFWTSLALVAGIGELLTRKSKKVKLCEICQWPLDSIEGDICYHCAHELKGVIK
jgi:hypothetical protein